jgi:nucleoside-diphosphate-sugar epimerase
VIETAWLSGVRRVLFLGSSCIYPSLAEQPIQEVALLTGPLEPTNRPYAHVLEYLACAHALFPAPQLTEPDKEHR